MSQEKLAIDGGLATLDTSELPWPVTTDAIRAAVMAALDDGSWGKYESHPAERFVEKIKTFTQTEGAILCSSGTIAVELALRGAGVRADNEVILAGYDFPGNFRAIESIGALPVLVDVVKNGWVIDCAQLELAFSDRTAAVVVSHLHGQIADLIVIRELIEAHNQHAARPIMLVEDACQVPGGTLNGQPLGSFGDVGAFSFGGSKLLSAGRGGAIVSTKPEILQRARIFSQRGNEAFPLSQLQAAALIPQMETLQPFTTRRHASVLKLIEATSTLSDLNCLKQIVDDVLPAYYKVPWLLRDRTPGWTRSEFIQALLAEGVSVGEGFRGFLRRSPRRCRKTGTLVNSQIAAQQTVLLHHPVLLESEETIDLVAAAIKKVTANSQ
ncbi:MAG: perosamine synthetase [Mariniblastus sp.]